MRLSLYNSRINLNNQTDLLYNSASDRFLLIKRSVDISHLDKLNEVTYQQLQNGEFIVDDDIDEYERVINRTTTNFFNSDRVTLIINTTLNCNFNCWYCFETHNQATTMSPEIVGNIISLVNNFSSQGKFIEVSFFGGEPLLQYKRSVVPIADYLYSLKKSVGLRYTINFTTNGYLLNERRIKYLKSVGTDLFQITLDGGRDFHNKTRQSKLGDSYDKIIRNIRLISHYGMTVLLRINTTKDNIMSVESIIDDLDDLSSDEKSNIVVKIHQVWQDEANLNDIQNKLTFLFGEHGFQSSKQLMNNLKRPCYADCVNSFVVNYNGDVYKCTAIDFLNTKRDGYLNSDGIIIEENNAFKSRAENRFKNSKCKACRIFPICGGGCSQKPIHFNGKDYCIFKDDEDLKNDVILDRFIFNIRNNPKWSAK